MNAECRMQEFIDNYFPISLFAFRYLAIYKASSIQYQFSKRFNT